jgi:monoamine oxidase
MQVTEHFDIIIIGAGAAGLGAARELTRVKMKILLLEAQGRIGGRMYTNIPHGFTSTIERGAEFIHGEAAYTFKLLREANAEYYKIEGNTYEANDDSIKKSDMFDDDFKLVLEKLETLQRDMSFGEFLAQHFGDSRFENLREKITKFVEGYNAADITKVSSLALRQEWSEDEDPAQYRIKGGYEKLYGFLYHDLLNNGGVVKLNQEVTQINWSDTLVEVKTKSESFYAKKCLVTVPAPLLSCNAIAFQPAVPHVINAASQIGFGGVVKITLEFKIRFWETEPPRKFKKLQFLFSDESIPTWWSQFPEDKPVLTGWLGGPSSERIEGDDDDLFQKALESLANALHYQKNKIEEQVVARSVDRWTTRTPFSNGAYSYSVLGTPEAVKTLRQGLNDKIYFAGEALYTGPHRSTVEAALISGKDVSTQIIKKFI